MDSFYPFSGALVEEGEDGGTGDGDDDEVNFAGDGAERGVGLEALDFRGRRVYRVDTPGVAAFDKAADVVKSHLVGVSGGADDGDGARVEDRLKFIEDTGRFHEAPL
jgi:hypothetical protein